ACSSSLSSLCGQRRREPPTQLRRTRRDHARTCGHVEWRGVERRRLDELDRQAELADEELRGRNVDRTGRLERAHAVEPAGGEVAEREGERAHDPQAVREPDDVRRVLGDERRQRRLERERLDLVLRLLAAERTTAEERSAPALRRPLLAGAEV